MPNDGGPVSLVDMFQVAEPAAAQPAFDFDRLVEQYKKRRNIDWTVPEAFLCCLLSAAVADGNFSIEQQAEIRALSLRSRALKSVSASQLALANATVNQRLRTRPNGLQEACESLPADMRLPLFAHCVDIILAGGQLLPIELDFLNRIMGYLGIDAAEGKRVMEALLIKNRF